MHGSRLKLGSEYLYTFTGIAGVYPSHAEHTGMLVMLMERSRTDVNPAAFCNRVQAADGWEGWVKDGELSSARHAPKGARATARHLVARAEPKLVTLSVGKIDLLCDLLEHEIDATADEANVTACVSLLAELCAEIGRKPEPRIKVDAGHGFFDMERAKLESKPRLRGRRGAVQAASTESVGTISLPGQSENPLGTDPYLEGVMRRSQR